MYKPCTRTKRRLKKDQTYQRITDRTEAQHSGDATDIGWEQPSIRRPAAVPYKDVQSQDMGHSISPDVQVCSQEPFLYSSQDVDSQREVRWNYQSPETIRKLRKCQGQYSSDEVKKYVNSFSDNVTAAVDNTCQSTKMHLSVKEVTTLSRNELYKKKVTKKSKKASCDGDLLQHMIQFLHREAVKPNPDDGEPSNGSSEITSLHEHSSTSIELTETTNSIFTKEDGTVQLSTSIGEENCWSDDDLFKDNSFLIEATQNPEKYMKASHNSSNASKPGASPNPCKKSSSLSSHEDHKLSSSVLPGAAQTSADNSYVIPPSCSSKQNLSRVNKTSNKVPPSKPSNSNIPISVQVKIAEELEQNHHVSKLYKNDQHALKATVSKPEANSSNQNIKPKFEQGFQPQGTSAASFNKSSTISKLATRTYDDKKAGNCGLIRKTLLDPPLSQSSQSAIINPPPGAMFKTSFRKFNSFQDDDLPRKLMSQDKVTKDYVKSNHKPTFQKTLSFDSSFTKISSKNTSELSLAKHKNTTDLACETVLKHKTLLPTPSSSELDELLGLADDSSNSLFLEDGFDVSLPEDLFQTMTEVDEILSSQAGVTSASTGTTNLNVCDVRVSLPTLLHPPDINQNISSSRTLKSNHCALVNQAAAATVSHPMGAHARSSLVMSATLKGKQAPAKKITENFMSPVKPVAQLQNIKKAVTHSPTHTYFKKTFSLRNNSPHRLKGNQQAGPALPNSSTPLKGGKKEASGVTDEAQLSDSVFDDSFTSDNALFESQILPFLEKVEAEAVLDQKGILD